MILSFLFLLFSTSITQAEPKNSNLVTSALISKISENVQHYTHVQTDLCVSILILRAFENFSKMYIIIPKSEENERLIKNLQKNFLNSIFTDPDKIITMKLSFNFQLYLFYHNITIEEIIKLRQTTTRTKFLVLVKDYNDGIKNLQEFWKYREIDVVVTYVVNLTAYYYTYYPYSKNHCGEIGEPVLLAECDLKKGKFIKKELRPKTEDLHGCSINVTLSAISPAVHYSGGELTGMEVELMDELLYNMNAVPNYILDGAEKVRYGVNTGYKDLLEKSEIAGGATLSLKGVSETDFFTYGQSVCVTWGVPVQPNRPQAKMRFMYDIFPTSIWLLIAATIILTSTAFKIFGRSHKAETFKLLSLLFDSPIHSNLKPKIFFCLWLWFTFIINATYRGAFQSKLLAIDIPQQIHTTEEIFNSTLTISGRPEILEEIMPIITRNFTIDPNRLTRVEFKNYIEDSKTRKTVAYLGLREILLYHSAKNNLAYYIYIQKTCIVHYHLVFVLKKNSHLTRTISKIANQLTENGFTSFLFKKYFHQPKGQITQEEFIKYLQQHPLKLDLYKLGIEFIIFTCGIIISTTAFIIELLKLF